MKQPHRFSWLKHFIPRRLKTYPVAAYEAWRQRLRIAGGVLLFYAGGTLGGLAGGELTAAQRRDFIVVVGLVAVVGVLCLVRVFFARQRAARAQGVQLEAAEPGRLRFLRYLRFGLLYTALFVTTFSVTAWKEADFVGFVLMALWVPVIALYLVVPAKAFSPAARAEKADILAEQIAQLSDALADDIQSRFRSLQQQKAAATAQAEQIRQLVDANVTPGVKAILEAAQQGQNRTALLQGWFFAAVGFVLGIFGNWLYDLAVR